jgi:hypothetical protein
VHLMSHLLTSGEMARTTFDLDPSVLEQLRRRAVREGKSMGRLASELLAQQLVAQPAANGAQELQWTSRDLGVPRVDLDDKEALRALLDGEP